MDNPIVPLKKFCQKREGTFLPFAPLPFFYFASQKFKTQGHFLKRNTLSKQVAQEERILPSSVMQAAPILLLTIFL